MPRTVGVIEAASQLEVLVDAARRGERVVLTRGGQPAAQLTACPSATSETWSDTILDFALSGPYDPAAFEVDRADVQ